MNSDPSTKSTDHIAPQTAINILPAVGVHSCYLLYPVETVAFPGKLSINLGSLVSQHVDDDANGKKKLSNWIIDDVLETITEKRAAMKVWEPGTLTPGSDLHGHIQRLLGGNILGGAAGRQVDEGIDSASNISLDLHASVYRLTETAKKILRGERLSYAKETPKLERAPKQLLLVLTESAKRRMRNRIPCFEGKYIEVKVCDVQYVIFRTGYAFLMVEVRFGDQTVAGIDPYYIVEGLYNLSRFNKLTWASREGNKIEDAPIFNFGTMIRSLIGKSAHIRKTQRVFTASYVQFLESPEPVALKQLMIQLARHYNDEYHVQENLPGVEYISHFDNVTHLYSLEGCVTVVDLCHFADGECPGFLENYRTHTYQHHYLLIILLVYHEFCFLLHATNDASFWPKEKNERHAIEKMERIRHAVTNFTLCFRFSYISRVSMHNDVHQALRKAMGLDWMLHELDRDTAQIDAFLHHASETRQEKRFRWASVIGVFGITWLTTYPIFKEFLEVKIVHDLLNLPHDNVGTVAAGIGLVTGLVAAVLTGIQGSRGHGHSTVDHAVHENVIHQAKN